MENQENQTENILDNKERAYATGKRKNSIARVWLKRGDGKILVNGKSLDKYFARPVLQMTGLKTERTQELLDNASPNNIFTI